MFVMMYTKVHKTSFYGQGLTRKDDCFHGLLTQRLDGNDNSVPELKLYRVCWTQ